MRKIITSLLLALLTVSANAQFLFRISGADKQSAPSYMLGTIHLLPASLLDSIPAYQEAEAQCRQLFIEYDVNDKQAMDSLMSKGEYMMRMPEGKTILDLLSKEQTEKLKECIKDGFFISVEDSDIVAHFNYQPVVLLLTLKIAPLTRAMVKYPELRPQGMILDKGCAQRAKERNMTMGNLDEFNLDSIKKANKELLQSLDMQADSLISFLNGYELYKKNSAEEVLAIVQAVRDWKAGDYEHFSSSEYWLEQTEMPLFRDRNEKWLPKMLAAMREAPTMFVFGAGHLVGPHGVIQLLRNAGCQVEQVK
ncbi:MAG: TraB/GumN family protein [Prevotella sp.]|nr:TraB/GumN family protein [Prevotella sp.]